MNGWKELPPALITKICDYIPPSRLIHVGSTCKPWYNTLLPRIYSTLPVTIWLKSNCIQIINQFGPYFKVIENCISFAPSKNFLDLLKCCNNIEKIYLTRALYHHIQHIEMDTLFPNLTSISMYQIIDKFQLDSNLKNLIILQFDYIILTYLRKVIHASLYDQIQQFSISNVEFDFNELEYLIPKFNNLTHFNFHTINDYKSIEYHHIFQLFNWIGNWKNLQYLTITLHLYKFADDPETNPFQFPTNFSIQQLKTFNIDINVKADFSEDGSSDSEHEDWRERVPTFYIGYHVHPNLFTPLFTSTYLQLNELHLAMMDSDLLEKVSHSCPNLIQLTMDAPLPIPTSNTNSFSKLKRLNSCGFYPKAIDYQNTYNIIFPKVTVFYHDETRYTNWSHTVTFYHYIKNLFPNVTSAYLYIDDEDEELDNIPFWSQPILEEFTWSKIVIPENMFRKTFDWLQMNAPSISPGFTLLIDESYPDMYCNKERYRFLLRQYPQHEYYLCKSVNRFEFKVISKI